MPDRNSYVTENNNLILLVRRYCVIDSSPRTCLLALPCQRLARPCPWTLRPRVRDTESCGSAVSCRAPRQSRSWTLPAAAQDGSVLAVWTEGSSPPHLPGATTGRGESVLAAWTGKKFFVKKNSKIIFWLNFFLRKKKCLKRCGGDG